MLSGTRSWGGPLVREPGRDDGDIRGVAPSPRPHRLGVWELRQRPGHCEQDGQSAHLAPRLSPATTYTTSVDAASDPGLATEPPGRPQVGNTVREARWPLITNPGMRQVFEGGTARLRHGRRFRGAARRSAIEAKWAASLNTLGLAQCVFGVPGQVGRWPGPAPSFAQAELGGHARSARPVGRGTTLAHGKVSGDLRPADRSGRPPSLSQDRGDLTWRDRDPLLGARRGDVGSAVETGCDGGADEVPLRSRPRRIWPVS